MQINLQNVSSHCQQTKQWKEAHYAQIVNQRFSLFIKM